MFGFIPGFSYLEGLPKAMMCERKQESSFNSLSNVLALGGPYIGIHCLPSPTGWNVIGRIPLQILNIINSIPQSLRVGDEIKIDDYNYTIEYINKEVMDEILLYQELFCKKT